MVLPIGAQGNRVTQAALLLIRQQQRIVAEHGHGVQWGRFSVLLSWKRGAPATNEELSAFCSHYGPVRRRTPYGSAMIDR